MQFPAERNGSTQHAAVDLHRPLGPRGSSEHHPALRLAVAGGATPTPMSRRVCGSIADANVLNPAH